MAGRLQLTSEDMHPLIVQVRTPPRREVNVPPVAKPVHLGRPYVAAARGVPRRVDDLLSGRLEPVDGRRPRNLDRRPRRREEVVVAVARVRQERVGAARAADRVGEGRGREGQQAQEGG